MADYTPLTNFTAKDTLPEGDPQKKILGSDVDAEFNSISTANNSKADKISGGADGNIVTRNASGNIQDGGLALANVENSWQEVYSLPSPVNLASAWQEDVISSTYSVYRILFTYGIAAVATIKLQYTISGTPDGSNVYARYQSRESLTGTPGPTVTGSTGVDNFFDSSQLGTGPFAGYAEFTIHVRPDVPSTIWTSGIAQGASTALTLRQQYTGASGNPDGLQISGTSDITLTSVVVLGLRNS